ncbi:MAG: hypothetical protein M1340_07905 [Actinobacteria bacterium]|jgi:hypothetical protein|nr:hypothetical protein [Actinomycetota bacterium]MCL6093739.1 hypothetical protein [Actinomycetota bacterium]
MGLIATIVAVSMVLLTAQAAMATVTAGGASSSPQTAGSSGAATTSGTGKTGGEVILFAAVGVGLLGTGYLLTRKSKA